MTDEHACGTPTAPVAFGLAGVVLMLQIARNAGYENADPIKVLAILGAATLTIVACMAFTGYKGHRQAITRIVRETVMLAVVATPAIFVATLLMGS